VSTDALRTPHMPSRPLVHTATQPQDRSFAPCAPAATAATAATRPRCAHCTAASARSPCTPAGHARPRVCGRSRFAVESVAFNGALLLAAWRFSANSSRGQAHARRLFLVSLAYLPIFFGCLLLHQRRQPLSASAALDDELPTDHEADAPLAPSLEQTAQTAEHGHPLGRLRAAGRELCLHEQMVEMREVADADGATAARASDDDGAGRARAAVRPALTGGASALAASAGKVLGCPVVVAEAVSEQVVTSAAHTASNAQAARAQP
jgi:hypothetical protein